MIAQHMALDYTLHPGWMAPFVEALMDGRAMARRCDGCARVSYPPLRVCECGDSGGEWVTLSGDAQIEWRTTGADGDFALVRFDGADTRSVVRLAGLPAEATQVQLQKPTGTTPELCLGPMEKGAHP